MEIPSVLVRVLLVVGLMVARPARADSARVAVAANFSAAFERLAPMFHRRTGHTAVASTASTGQLYAQVLAGAPFDVFMSADAARPEKLARAGLAVAGTGFTYARGQLVVLHAGAGPVDIDALTRALTAGGAVAIADPRTAPYGAAAAEFLRTHGLWEQLEGAGRLAVAASVTQAYQFVKSGAAPYGFVALSQVVEPEDGARAARGAGSNYLRLSVGGGALDQQAILLSRGRNNAAATAFLAFVRTDPAARREIQRSGYVLP